MLGFPSRRESSFTFTFAFAFTLAIHICIHNRVRVGVRVLILVPLSSLLLPLPRCHFRASDSSSDSLCCTHRREETFCSFFFDIFLLFSICKVRVQSCCKASAAFCIFGHVLRQEQTAAQWPNTLTLSATLRRRCAAAAVSSSSRRRRSRSRRRHRRKNINNRRPAAAPAAAAIAAAAVRIKKQYPSLACRNYYTLSRF